LPASSWRPGTLHVGDRFQAPELFLPDLAVYRKDADLRDTSTAVGFEVSAKWEGAHVVASVSIREPRWGTHATPLAGVARQNFTP
jgi:hypothetical protein